MDRAGPYRAIAFGELASTNDEAMARLRSGDPGGLFVTASCQSAGRGRSGRTWESPAGNLYASLALRDPAPLSHVPQLGLVAGVALLRTVRGLVRDPDHARLKWPNDVLLGGAKLAGILLESAPLPDGGQGCVIGFGINCISHPTGLAYAATDLRAATDRPPRLQDVLMRLAGEIAQALEVWDGGLGFGSIREAWMGAACGLGGAISVKVPGGEVHGIFRGIDRAGHLQVETQAGQITIAAGDVILPGSAMDIWRRAPMVPERVLEGAEKDV